MLTKQLQKQLEQGDVAFFPVERAYAEKHGFLPAQATERTMALDVLERCSKETEELLAAEQVSFLQTPLRYFREQPEQFLYTEASFYDNVRIDALAIEFDDLFKTYTALFGLKLQKKYEQPMRAYLDTVFPKKYSVSFDGKDGLWEVNVYLNVEDGDKTLEQVFVELYTFIFTLLEAVEEA